MGQMLNVPLITASTDKLNDLFNAENLAATKFKVEVLRVIFPRLLKVKDVTGKRKKRQRTLRFAAWLLTADVKFSKATGAKDPSNGNFRKWLKWLTWLYKESAGNWNYTIAGSPPTDTSLSPHDQILQTIEEGLEENIIVTFDWEKKSSGRPELIIRRDKTNPPFTILVKSIHEGDVTGAEADEDDNIEGDDP